MTVERLGVTHPWSRRPHRASHWLECRVVAAAPVARKRECSDLAPVPVAMISAVSNYVCTKVEVLKEISFQSSFQSSAQTGHEAGMLCPIAIPGLTIGLKQTSTFSE